MKPDYIPEGYIAIILREVLLGIAYLHSEGKIHRDIKGYSKSTRTDVSCQFASYGDGRSKTGGFWSFWTIDLEHDKEKHLCRDAILDGPRSHSSIRRVRCQGRYLVTRHYRNRVGTRRTAVQRYPSDESSLHHSKERTSTIRRKWVLGRLQRFR